MSKTNLQDLFDYLLNSDTTVVLDIDGTMGVYMFGEVRHSACAEDQWRNFVETYKPYKSVVAIPQMQSFVKKKCSVNSESIRVCSVSQDFEREDKLNFVLREYPTIKPENIHFVNSKHEKIELLHVLANRVGSEDKIAIVDDTVKTLDMIYEQSEFVTVHNSVFMLYKE